MTIVCPSCEAAYDIDPAKLAGRAVRCVRCGHQWQPGLPPARPAAPGAIATWPSSQPDATDPVESQREMPANDTPAGDKLGGNEDAAVTESSQAVPEVNYISPPDTVPEVALPVAAPPPLAQLPVITNSKVRTAFDDDADFYIDDKPPSRGARIAWAVSITAILAILWALYAYRGGVIASWPPSIRVYDALGLNP